MKNTAMRKGFWKYTLFTLLLGLVFLVPCLSEAASFKTTKPTVVDPRYSVQILVPGSYFHGIHGLTFDSQDNLYAGSVVGQATYAVDRDTGRVKEFISPPYGMADDLEFGPDGKLYYTSYLEGKLRCKSIDGKITVLAEGLPGLNSLAFNKDGRLFATQVFMGDALYEIDLSGQGKTRKIAEGLGGLNGFDFGPDNMLYGPLWFKGVVARVDVNTGKVETVAGGFGIPAAANFDPEGNLFAVDTAKGEVVQIDIATGQKKIIAKVYPSIDNLAIDSKGRIFISNMSRNGIYEIDRKTGKARTVVEGALACSTGVSVKSGQEGDTLYVADVFAYKKVDGFTGEVTMLKASHAAGSHLVYPSKIAVKGNEALLLSPSVGLIQVMDLTTNEMKMQYGKLRAPGDALVLDDGSMLVAEMGSGKILKINGPDPKDRSVIIEGLAAPAALAPAGNKGVYVAESSAGTVSLVDLAGGNKKVIATGLRGPTGIGVLPDGKLAAVEYGAGRLVEIDPASGAVKALVVDLAMGYPKIRPALTASVAVSGSGTIYVTGDIENVIYKIMPK